MAVNVTDGRIVALRLWLSFVLARAFKAHAPGVVRDRCWRPVERQHDVPDSKTELSGDRLCSSTADSLCHE